MSSGEMFTQEEVDDIRQEGYDEGYDAATEDRDREDDKWRGNAQDVLDEACSIVETAFEDINRLRLLD